ncbi:MAG: helix-turn-helix transcriptional regulator [Paludibacteraceae bacterium]|nr:helix-turn-helix transcriptional regulator [Paludibacteraceae bacterium]MBP5743023.1 helix-turn-helix transcriptional regulator [Paludibacteraceae bacterium]
MKYDEELTKVVGKLKQVRIQKGLTVQELAYRCDMERSNVSRIEAGKTNITFKTLCTLCNALDLQWSDLFDS